MITLDKLVRNNIRQLMPYASARSEFKGQADIFLDANENPFDTGLNRYPDPLQSELKEMIGAVRGVDAGRIFLGNGSDEVIDLLIRIFCEPRLDHIITLPPTYGMYKVSAGIADVAVREISLTPAFQPDVERILDAADEHSKILFICSPNNPTGNSMEPERIRQLADRFPGITVVDEAYIDFADQPSLIPWLASHRRLVLMQTFSKAWGMAGIRLGMAFADRAIIELFNKVKPPYNVNSLSQRAAMEAIRERDERRAWIDQLLAQRSVVEQFLAGLPFVERVYPSDANFLLVKVSDPAGLYRFLVERAIIVRDRSRVHLCDGALRITIGTQAENEQLFRALLAYAEQPVSATQNQNG